MENRRKPKQVWGGLLAALMLLGCAGSPMPMARPALSARPATLPEPTAVETSASADARAYYGQVQQALLSQELLRTDGGGPDTPFNARTLANNFLRIALFNEYDENNGNSVQRETESILRRWQDPVRVGLHFGASVPADMRGTDTARVGSYLQRLSGLTGHPVALNDRNPNFHVYIVSEDERRTLGPALRAALPNLSESEVRGITDMPTSTYCIVYAQSEGGSGVYRNAFAVIRSEHPDLLRLSCIHEELAQALGLPNDSPRARPSIFNDDEEFALLTKQDELMLRMLYSPELRPGMTLPEALPIVQTLAARLLGGPS